MYVMTRARWVCGPGQVPDIFLIVNDVTSILAATACENELPAVSLKLRRWHRTEEE